MQEVSRGFVLPPSPFAREKARLERELPPARAVEDVPNPRRGGRRYLSDEQRQAVARSTDPAWCVAEENGISEEYVKLLRRRYDRGQL